MESGVSPLLRPYLSLLIIVPESKAPSREEMERMVTEINETQVEEEEVLSNRVYFYDIRAKKMS
ncbi:DUF5688 family protein [Faecalimonas hominis]